MQARLKQRYLEEIRPQLVERFGYSSPMQAPRIEKIALDRAGGSHNSHCVARHQRWRLGPWIRGWLSQRDLPGPAAKSFRQMWRARSKA